MKNKRRLGLKLNKLNKKAIVMDYLPWLIIGVAVLTIVMITIFILKNKGVSLIDQLKGLFRG